tara:strand:- start:567 stop:926 length:360 start_codon:yes stop_codon:yes gene_type:complete
MYNYSYDVSYSHIQGDSGDTAYRKAFLGANNTSMWSDTLIKDNQNAIYEKFKDNDEFKSILKKGKEYGFQLPFELDDYYVIIMLFSFNFYETFHKCLKDLFNNNKISEENFIEMVNLLS